MGKNQLVLTDHFSVIAAFYSLSMLALQPLDLALQRGGTELWISTPSAEVADVVFSNVNIIHCRISTEHGVGLHVCKNTWIKTHISTHYLTSESEKQVTSFLPLWSRSLILGSCLSATGCPVSAKHLSSISDVPHHRITSSKGNHSWHFDKHSQKQFFPQNQTNIWERYNLWLLGSVLSFAAPAQHGG